MGRSKRRFLVLVALIVAAVCGIAAWALTRPDAVEGGPLAYEESYSDLLTFTVPLDTAYSWGLPVLRNSGDADAVVESVSLADQSGTIREVGVRAVPETAGISVGFAPGFDPAAGVDVEGLVVPPGSGNGFQLVFGFEVGDPGVSGFRGVLVEYRVGGKRYATTLKHVVVLCAPVEQFEECPGSESAPAKG